MLRHLQNILKWGHLPTLKRRQDRLSSSLSIHPLSTHDFICHVLLPEAAILLIMEDKGWAGDVIHQWEWDDARNEASVVKAKSVEYGRWKFQADGEAAEATLSQLEKREPELKRHIERARDSRVKAKRDDRENSKSQAVVVSDEDSITSLITAYPIKPSKRPCAITTPDSNTTDSATSRSVSPSSRSAKATGKDVPPNVHSASPPTPPLSVSSRTTQLPSLSQKTPSTVKIATQASPSSIYDNDDDWFDDGLIEAAGITDQRR